MSGFANYDEAWASIIFAYDVFEAMARFSCKITFLYVQLSWPPHVMPLRGNIIFSPPKFSKQQHQARGSTNTSNVIWRSSKHPLHFCYIQAPQHLLITTCRPALTLSVCGTFRTEGTSDNVCRNVESFTFRKQMDSKNMKKQLNYKFTEIRTRVTPNLWTGWRQNPA